MTCCLCCFTHYEDVIAPEIGKELIPSNDASNYKLSGGSLMLCEIQVPPQHIMIGEPGAFSYYKGEIELTTQFNDGASPEEPGCCYKCKMSCARSCSGEQMSVAHFENTSTQESATIAFATDLPGQIVPINLGEMPDNVIFTMNGSFLFGPKGTRIDVVKTDCAQCCFGAGCCFQKLDGNGVVFISGGGSVIRQDLRDTVHRVDSSSLLAFTKGLKVDVRRNGGCGTMCCGGEGFALTTIEGTGSYWLASSPVSEQIAYALQFLPPKK